MEADRTGQETFGDVIREVIRVSNRTQDAVAEAGGLSPSYLNNWLKGRRPQLPKLEAAAEGWEAKRWLTPDLRQRLFRACGYVDRRGPAEESVSYEAVQPPFNVRAFQRLSEEDREELGEQFDSMIELRLKRRGLN